MGLFTRSRAQTRRWRQLRARILQAPPAGLETWSTPELEKAHAQLTRAGAGARADWERRNAHGTAPLTEGITLERELRENADAKARLRSLIYARHQ